MEVRTAVKASLKWASRSTPMHEAMPTLKTERTQASFNNRREIEQFKNTAIHFTYRTFADTVLPNLGACMPVSPVSFSRYAFLAMFPSLPLAMHLFPLVT